MLSFFSQLLTAFGLSSASGLNAYIPLLIVALAARNTNLITLNPPFDVLTNDWVIGALGVLLVIEMIVDKIPAADTINDLFQTFVRPVAGAVLFAASTNVINLHPAVAVIAGLILAFSVHAVKATARPVVTASTLGVGNAAVSVAEDIVSVTVSLLALLAPLVVGVVVVVVIVLLVLWRFGGERAPARR